MSLKVDWIKNKLKENNFDKSKVYCMLPEFQKETGSDFWSEDTYKRYVRQAFSRLVADGEIDCSDELIKLESNKQKIMDTNNLLRKSNRENYRLYNTLEETYKEYVNQLDKINVPFTIKSHKSNDKAKVGIMTFSDIHCNELILPTDSFDNTYNFESDLKKIIKKKDLRDNFMFIDYTSNNNYDIINKKFKSNIKSVPAIIYIKNGEFVKSIDSSEHMLNVGDFEKLLDEYEVK